MLQILQITHLPGHLERPEYECRPPCSTPQKQKVTEHVSCEGYSGVSGLRAATAVCLSRVRWLVIYSVPRGTTSSAGLCTAALFTTHPTAPPTMYN